METQPEKINNKEKEKEKTNEEKSTAGQSMNEEKVNLKPVKKDIQSEPEPKKEVPALKPVERKQANKETSHDKTVQLKPVEKQGKRDVPLKSNSKESVAKSNEEPAPKSTKDEPVRKERSEPLLQKKVDKSEENGKTTVLEDKPSIEKPNMKKMLKLMNLQKKNLLKRK
jgi:hypothetical protein